MHPKSLTRPLFAFIFGFRPPLAMACVSCSLPCPSGHMQEREAARAAEIQVMRTKSEIHQPNRRFENEVLDGGTLEFQRRRLLSEQHHSEEIGRNRLFKVADQEQSSAAFMPQQRWLQKQMGEIEARDRETSSRSTMRLRTHGCSGKGDGNGSTSGDDSSRASSPMRPIRNVADETGVHSRSHSRSPSTSYSVVPRLVGVASESSDNNSTSTLRPGERHDSSKQASPCPGERP